MASNMIGNLAVNLTMNTAAFQRGATIAEKRGETLSQKMSGIGASMKTIGAGLAVGLAASGITEAIGSAFELGSSLTEAASKVGVTVEALQEMRYVADQNGVSIETMDKSLNKLTRNLGELNLGNKTTIETFNQLGLSAKDFAGLDPTAAFSKVAEALKNVSDASTRDALGTKILGRAYTELKPIVDLGAAGIAAAVEEKRKDGVISEEEAAKLDYLADRWARLKTNVGVASAGMIASFALNYDKFVAWYEGYDAGARAFSGSIGKMVDSVVGMVFSFQKNFQAVVYGAVDIGKNIVMGLARGITASASAVWVALKSVVMSGISNVRAFLGIKSPSRLFMEMGGYVTEGFAIGIANGATKVDAAMVGLGHQISISGEDMVDLANDNAENLEVSNVRIVKSFADTARDVLGSVNGLAQAIKGGGAIGILEGIANLFLSLGSAGVFGGKLQANINKPIPGRARGGYMTSNRSYLVGERGPEIMTMGGRPGFMTPNNATAGAGRSTSIEVLPSPYFNVVVDGRADGRVATAAPGIATAAAAGVQTNMQQSGFRSLP